MTEDHRYRLIFEEFLDKTEDGFIVVDRDGVITDIEVYAQSETAGYMDRVISANKNKYVGKNVFERALVMADRKSVV